MVRRSKRVGALVGVLAVAVLSAACSSSSSGGQGLSSASSAGSVPPASPGSATAPTGTPIKIGVLTSLATYGQNSPWSADTTQAWAKWINASGGLDNHPVSLTVMNSMGDPATAISNAETVINKDKVDLIVLGDDITELAASKILAASGVPVIGYATTSLLNNAPNFFATSAVIPVLYAGVAGAAAAVGAKTYGDVACAEDPNCSAGDPTYAQAAKVYGIKFTGTVTASTTAPSYTAQCITLMQQGDDYIQLSMVPSAQVRIESDCTQQGYKGWFGFSGGGTNAAQFGTVKGISIAGAIWAAPWWGDSAPVKQYRDVMTQYNPATWNNEQSSATWAALQVFHEAAAHLGAAVSPQSVTAALYTVKNQTLGGLLAQPVTFTKGKPSPVVNCMFLYEYRDGAFTTKTVGASGNGQAGDMQSSCYDGNH
jgi:branched-chain amino acid transport system substrate-binding protein